MLPMIFVMTRHGATGPPPVVSAPTVATLNAGACASNAVSVSASIRVSWIVTNPDAIGYSAKLYENGINVSTQDTTASMHYDKTVVGAVEGDPGHVWSSDWTYRVDIVNKTSSAVVSSQTSTAWQKSYGDCSGSLG